MPENESDIFRLLFHGKYVSDFDDIKNEKMRSQVIHIGKSWDDLYNQRSF